MDALALLRDDLGFSSDFDSWSVLDFLPLLLVDSLGDSDFLPIVSDSISTLSSDNSIGSSSSLDCCFFEGLPLRPLPPLGLSFTLRPLAGALAPLILPLDLFFSSDSES